MNETRSPTMRVAESGLTSVDPLQTPVVLLVFNRPDTTARVFAEVAKARPSRLLVVADGPRPDHPDDVQQCSATRAIIEQVNWDCEVSLNYAERNLGLRRRVVSGLDWAFGLVDEAIILEDDCLPHPDFFWFCERMLACYRSDDRIMMVSGTNYLTDQHPVGDGYFFCRYFAIWGWATWRRAWEKYDDELHAWSDLRGDAVLKGLYGNAGLAKYLAQMFDSVATGQIDTWDIPWFYSCLLNHGLTVTPAVNLVANIGVVGTHTRRKPSRNHFLATAPMPSKEVPLREWVYPDVDYERLLYQKVLRRPLHFRLLKRLKLLDMAAALRSHVR